MGRTNDVGRAAGVRTARTMAPESSGPAAVTSGTAIEPHDDSAMHSPSRDIGPRSSGLDSDGSAWCVRER